MFEQTFKNFIMNFTALNERNTVSSGDLIRGNFSFELSKETKITSIMMTLTGMAHVHWSTGGGGGRKRRSHRRHFNAKLDFFNLKTAIVQENNAVGGTSRLPPGTHVYPFTCQVPQGDFPTTFSGAHGKIMYALTVSIYRPWRLSKDFVTELNFVNRINTNEPELQAPLSGTNSMTLCCLWCTSGLITIKASLEKKAFVPGETVRIFCVCSNGSSRTATPKAKLQQKQFFYTHNKSHQRLIQRNLVCVTGQPISAQISDVHTEIMLTIPNLTALTISNCSILKVDYMIELTFGVRASPDLTVLFPIILCDTPVQSLPPTYHDS
eukprot:superscaffoldBa00003955_g18010